MFSLPFGRLALLASAISLALSPLMTSAATASPTPATTLAVWQVNKGASHLAFAATVMNQRVDGQFRRWDAQIHFDPQALAQSSVAVTIDMTSAASGDATRDQSLPSPDWFNAAAFPRATFTANRFQSLGNNRYQALGDLTIRGVRHSATLPFTLSIVGNTAQMQGSLTINRQSFGVGQGQWKGVETVAANVQVNVNVTAQRAR